MDEVLKQNMRVWMQVCVTDPEMTEKLSFGAHRYTTIDAQYQIKQATMVFGPCGRGWGIKDSKFEVLHIDPADPHWSLLAFTAKLWFRDGDGEIGEFDIASDIELFENTKNGWKRMGDAMKKVRTDAVTKGLSWLGFSSDVFEGKFDDSKYIAKLNAQKEKGQFRQPKGLQNTNLPLASAKPATFATGATAEPTKAPDEPEPAKETSTETSAAEPAAEPAAETKLAAATTAAPAKVTDKVKTETFKVKLDPEMKDALGKCQDAWQRIQSGIERFTQPEDRKMIQDQLADLSRQTLGLEFIPTAPQPDVTLEKLQNIYPHLGAFLGSINVLRRLRALPKAEEAMTAVQGHLGAGFVGKFTIPTLSESSRMIVAHDAQPKVKSLVEDLTARLTAGTT
jgi:hypothetical protein